METALAADNAVVSGAFTRLRLVGCQTQSDNVVEARTSFRKERSPCLNEPLMVASTGVAHSERLINIFDIFNLNEKQREFPAPPWAGVKRVTPARVPSLRLPFNHFLRHRSRHVVPTEYPPPPFQNPPPHKYDSRISGYPSSNCLPEYDLNCRAMSAGLCFGSVCTNNCTWSSSSAISNARISCPKWSEVVRSLRKQLSHIVLHYIQNRVSTLWAPDEVILTGTNRMCVTAVLFHP